MQTTSSSSFDFHSPSISGLTQDGPGFSSQNALPTNGTGKLRLVGANMWVEGSPTNVTIGGATSGVVIDASAITLGILTPTNVSSARRASVIVATQYIDIVVPPWQGKAVPIVVFKMLGSPGSYVAAGSDAVYVSFASPAVSYGVGSSGMAVAPLPDARLGQVPLTAHTNGTSRLRLTGVNFGSRFTFLEVSSGAPGGVRPPHALQGTDCTRGDTFVECTIPAGVGALDSFDLTPLYVYVVQPSAVCDPVVAAALANNASTVATAWQQCTLIASATAYAVSDSWLFQYDAPVVTYLTPSLPTVGGVLVIRGYNLYGQGGFGSAPIGFDMPVVSLTRGTATLTCAVLPNADGSVVVTLPGSDNLEQIRCQLGAGTGTGWQLMLTVAGQQYTGVSVFAFEPPEVQSLSNATGPTAGGYLVTVFGVNFGTNGSVIISPGGSPGSVIVVPSGSVVSYNQTNITFHMPPEQGPKNITVLVDGQQSQGIAFRYDPPWLFTLSPTVVSTDGAANVVVTGVNFGSRGASITVRYPSVNVTLQPLVDSNSPDDETLNANVTYVRGILPASFVVPNGSQHDDTLIVTLPGGMGTGAELVVEVSTILNNDIANPVIDVAQSNVLVFDYAPPTITDVVPNVIDATGMVGVALYGANFGFLSRERLAPGGDIPAPAIHFNGRPCLNAVLIPSTGTVWLCGCVTV